MEGEFPCLEVQGFTGGHWPCLVGDVGPHLSSQMANSHQLGTGALAL